MSEVQSGTGVEPILESFELLQLERCAVLAVEPLVRFGLNDLLGHDIPPLARRIPGLYKVCHVDASNGHNGPPVYRRAPKGPGLYGAPGGYRSPFVGVKVRYPSQ